MRLWLIFLLVLTAPCAWAEITHDTILPEIYKVYYHPVYGISLKPFKNSTVKEIPTNNDYSKSPGCYVMCFSNNKKHSVYPVDKNLYLMGQIRVAGYYHNGLCIPKGYEDKDLRQSKTFPQQCEDAFPERCEKGKCWASGKAAGW